MLIGAKLHLLIVGTLHTMCETVGVWQPSARGMWQKRGNVVLSACMHVQQALRRLSASTLGFVFIGLG